MGHDTSLSTTVWTFFFFFFFAELRFGLLKRESAVISLVFVFNDEKPKFLAHNEKWANHTGHISLFLSVVEWLLNVILKTLLLLP